MLAVKERDGQDLNLTRNRFGVPWEGKFMVSGEEQKRMSCSLEGAFPGNQPHTLDRMAGTALVKGEKFQVLAKAMGHRTSPPQAGGPELWRRGERSWEGGDRQ